MAPADESVRYAAQPLSTCDRRQWWQNIWRLKRFKDLDPRLLVLPGHDLDAVRSVPANDIVVRP